MKKTIVTLSAVAVLMGSTAMADGAADKHPDLAFRHHTMETIKDNTGALFAILKGQGEAENFDVYADAIAANAKAFTVVAKQKVPGGETLDAAWENFEDYSGKLDKFTADSAAIAALGNDATMQQRVAAFTALTKNCKACHDDYRKEH